MSAIPSTAAGGPISYAIFQLARAHRARAAELLRQLDLHPGQELLLMQLMERDGQTQSELLQSVGLDHSTVSKSLRRMQEAGLVVREPSTQDRRVLVVHLTPRGRSLREPIAALWRALEDVSAGHLTQDETQDFLKTALAITESFHRRHAALGDSADDLESPPPG